MTSSCRRRPNTFSPLTRPSPPLPTLAVELDELGRGRRIPRGLVVPPSAREPRETHRQPRVLLQLPPACRGVGRERELGAEHLEHDPGLEPDVGRLAGGGPRPAG